MHFAVPASVWLETGHICLLERRYSAWKIFMSAQAPAVALRAGWGRTVLLDELV